MPVTPLRYIARALSWLPLRANQAAGALLGRISWLANSSPRRITETNLALCYPELSTEARQALAKQSLIETGKQLTECAWIWHRPVSLILSKLVGVTGQNLIDDAMQAGKGLIMVSPHVGNWELCTLPLSRRHPMTYFYRPPRNPAMDRILVDWRSHLGGQPARLDAGGIREGLKVLKSGGILGILPDQEPNLQNGVFAPFFGQPALTMTLLSKLAHRSGATVLFCVSERLPSGAGWHFHIMRSEPEVSSQQLDVATAALNRGVERCVSIQPAQYLWDYKRFNTLEDGSRRKH